MEQLFEKLENKFDEYLYQETKSVTYEVTFKNNESYIRCSIFPVLVEIDFGKRVLYIEDMSDITISIDNIVDIKEDLSEIFGESYVLETKDNYFRFDFI